MPGPNRKPRSCLTAPRRAERAFRRVLSSALLHLSRAVAPGAPHRPRSTRSSAPPTPHSPPQALPESEEPDTDDAQELPLQEPVSPAVHLQTETPTQPPQELAAPATVYDSPSPSPPAYATAPPDPLHDAAMDYDFALQDAPAGLDSPQFHGFLPSSQPAPFGFSPQQNASALQAFAPPPTPTVISPRTALGDLGMTRFMGANPVEEVTSSGPTRTPHDSPRASPYRRNSPQRTRARWTVPLPENAVASSSRLPDMPRAPTQASRRLPDTASPESFEPQYSARGSNLPPIASTSRRSPSLPVEGEMEVDELVAPPAAPTHAIISLPGTPFDGRFEIREDAPGLDLQEGGALGLAVGDENGSDEDEDDLTSHDSGDDVAVVAPQAALPEAAGNAVASSSRLPQIPTLEIEDRDMVVDAMASGPLEPPRAPRQAPLCLLGSPEHESFDSQYSAPRSDTPPVASTSNLPSAQAAENVEAQTNDVESDAASTIETSSRRDEDTSTPSSPAETDDTLSRLRALAEQANRPQPETGTASEAIFAVSERINELQRQVLETQEQSSWMEAQLRTLSGARWNDSTLQNALSHVLTEGKKNPAMRRPLHYDALTLRDAEA